MKQNKKEFDCVDYQRAVRLRNYEEAGGDFKVMLLKSKERLENNELWKNLNTRIKTKKPPKKADYLNVSEPETGYGNNDK